eukprot:TRINITY_DN426_c0_g1_i6.p1 TRINITY_DN426_c0_g1~~TRINITY_DN426_c0_g1_i6.p1  ORF type:complete len:455 (-),score=125.22 TRINITY_DN426_c0_g1_i6:2090-3454(-)
MIIYPSESFAQECELFEKKLNTYFELTANRVPGVKESLFSDEGVTAFIDEESNPEKYVYTILPLVDYVCFEIFNADSNEIEIKGLISQWRDYVQAARSHTSLYADVCTWKNFSFTLNDEQRKIHEKIEALVLTDELCELDDIVRVLCGLTVNKVPKALSSHEMANTISSNYIDIAKNRSAQNKLAKVGVETSLLQEKNEKLTSELSASQSVIAKKNEQLQEAQQNNNALKENTLKLKQGFEAKLEKASQQAALLNEEINALNQNNLMKVAELEAIGNDKGRLNERIEEEKNKNSELTEALANAEQQTSTLKQEIELNQLQLIQVQEELEAVFNDKVLREKVLEEKLKDVEQQLKHAMESQYAIQQESGTAAISDTDELLNAIVENELMQLQILQLQEELEFYFEKATSKQMTNEATDIEEQKMSFDDVAKAVTQKHNTLSLIGRLMSTSGIGVN